MNLKNKNWKTSLAGLGAILVGIGVAIQAHFDNDATTIVQWEVVLASVLAGLGLIFAKDGDKSTEQLAAK